ncbi:MAG: ABC transporter ATP-binding protein [Bradymonadia bacterium]
MSRLQVSNLRVDYEDTTAVKGIDLTVDAGMILGLIGPNGAGKTSLIRCVAALLDPTHGTILVDGINMLQDTSGALQRIGYMPDNPPLYDDLTVYEFLDMFASAYGVPTDRRGARIKTLIEQVRLTDKANSLCGGLSKGMRQRLFLAKCLLHDPGVLLLDEPASGLDPNARREFGEIIRALGDAGKAILVSSHILTELADFCNSVAIMEQGHMRIAGQIDDIVESLSQNRMINMKLVGDPNEALVTLETLPYVSKLESRADVICFEIEGDDVRVAACLKTLIDKGCPIIEYRLNDVGLREIFERVTDGGLA